MQCFYALIRIFVFFQNFPGENPLTPPSRSLSGFALHFSEFMLCHYFQNYSRLCRRCNKFHGHCHSLWVGLVTVVKRAKLMDLCESCVSFPGHMCDCFAISVSLLSLSSTGSAKGKSAMRKFC